jgi:predicted enzyme related to lactoylglutathione lyase
VHFEIGGPDGQPLIAFYRQLFGWDLEQTLASAESHGGSRVYGPLAVDDRMQTGAFRDPAGNVFGVYHRAAG